MDPRAEYRQAAVQRLSRDILRGSTRTLRVLLTMTTTYARHPEQVRRTVSKDARNDSRSLPARPISAPMLMVISPAKAMNFAAPDRVLPLTTPALKADIAELDTVTRKLRPRDLRQLMDISDKLAELNHQRFQAFDPSVEDGLQAAVAFNGDVYMGLAARTLDAKAFGWAQDHLRILSGLYGLLRPADAIQPYRLEMGVRLKTQRGKTLCQFWGDRLSRTLNEAAEGHKDRTLVNLASQEYFAAVDRAALDLPVVACRFFEDRGEAAKQISFMAKKARGLMARYAIDHRIDRAEGLKDFAVEGYAFRKDLSTESDWVFLRRRA